MEKQIHSKKVTVYYDVYNGDKKHTVVLIHGFGLDRNMWQDQIPALSEYKIICMDARGHGKSRPCDSFRIVDVAKDIKKILDKEGCNKAAIVGLSMGSYAAQEFVRIYPDYTSGILAADGTPLFIKYPKWEVLSLKWSEPMLKLFTWKSLLKTTVNQTSVKEDVKKKLLEMFSKQTKAEFVNSWSGVANALHEEKMEINCPFYVIYGDRDKSGTIKLHVNDWAKEYPECKVFEIPNAGHVSNMDNPEEFNKIMLQFLEDAAQDY